MRRRKYCNDHILCYRKKRKNRTPHGPGGPLGLSKIPNERPVTTSRHTDHELFRPLSKTPSRLSVPLTRDIIQPPYSPTHRLALIPVRSIILSASHTPALLCALIFVLHLLCAIHGLYPPPSHSRSSIIFCRVCFLNTYWILAYQGA